MKAVFTVCTPSYFANAKTLFQSLVSFNKEYILYLCVFNLAGYKTGDYFENLSIHIVDIESIGIAEYKKMRSQYDSFELSCALKPFVAGFIIETYQPEIMFYFDCDILIKGSLVKAENALLTNDILLTPHFTLLPNFAQEEELEKNNRILIEKGTLKSGVFNGGFFGLRRSAVTSTFLQWWQFVLIDGAYNAPSNGLFTDQLWLNIIPIYFSENLFILKDQGYNIAYWNLHERTLSYINGTYIVNNITPLVFYHFSGFKPDTFEITGFPCEYTLDNRPDLNSLFIEYNQLLLQNNYKLFSEIKILTDKDIHKKRKLKHYLKKLRLVK